MSKYIKLYKSQNEYNMDSEIKATIPRLVTIEENGNVKISVINEHDYTIVANSEINQELFNIAITSGWIDSQSEALTVYDCQKITTIEDVDFSSLLDFNSFENFISITKIPDNLFKDTNFTTIKLPPSIQEIGKYSFENTKINTIEIPKSVTSIGNFCFEGSNVNKIYFYSEIPPTVGYGWVDKNVTIYVPKESINDYRDKFGEQLNIQIIP